MKGSLEVVNIEIHCLKEPNYAMMFMASYGTLERVRDARRSCRVFSFLLAVTGVNCYLAQAKLFNQLDISQQDFEEQFANELIHITIFHKRRTEWQENQPGSIVPSMSWSLFPRTVPSKKTLVYCKTTYTQLVCSSSITLLRHEWEYTTPIL